MHVTSNFFFSSGMDFWHGIWHDVMVLNKYTFTDIYTPSSLVSLLCYAMLLLQFTLYRIIFSTLPFFLFDSAIN
jgi:hypothetical protein